MRVGVMIGQDMIVFRKPGLISASSEDEMTVLDAERGDFLQLNRTAAAIWALLDQPMTVAALCGRMAERFAIDPDDCRDDVAGFIAALGERGLVEITAAPHR